MTRSVKFTARLRCCILSFNVILRYFFVMALHSLRLMPPVYCLSQPIGKVEEGQPPDDRYNQDNIDDPHPSDRFLTKFFSFDRSHCMDLSFCKILRGSWMTRSTGLLQIISVDHRFWIRRGQDVMDSVTTGTVGGIGISTLIGETVEAIIIGFDGAGRNSVLT